MSCVEVTMPFPTRDVKLASSCVFRVSSGDVTLPGIASPARGGGSPWGWQAVLIISISITALRPNLTQMTERGLGQSQMRAEGGGFRPRPQSNPSVIEVLHAERGRLEAAVMNKGDEEVKRALTWGRESEE